MKFLTLKNLVKKQGIVEFTDKESEQELIEISVIDGRFHLWRDGSIVAGSRVFKSVHKKFMDLKAKFDLVLVS